MSRNTLFTAVFLAHLTAACGTTSEPQIEIRTVTVEVPIAVSCVPEALPETPVYRVTRAILLAAPDSAVRLTLAVAGFLEREARLAETEPVLSGCREAGQ